MAKEIIGRIDCPVCGGAGLMRITRDKNGDPFGYCERNCRQQLRIGGDAYRVKQFIERYPWAAPVTVTEPVASQAPAAEKIPVTVTEPAAKPAPVTVTAKPAPKKATFADALTFLGGGR